MIGTVDLFMFHQILVSTLVLLSVVSVMKYSSLSTAVYYLFYLGLLTLGFSYLINFYFVDSYLNLYVTLSVLSSAVYSFFRYKFSFVPYFMSALLSLLVLYQNPSQIHVILNSICFGSILFLVLIANYKTNDTAS